jgi:predicted ATP-dependent serine protease
MFKTCVPLYVSIDSPSALSLYCEDCGETIASWDGKAPTLDQLNAAAEKHCTEKHATREQATSTKTTNQ